MKTVMIYPDDKQEKAIHNYSEDLLGNMKIARLTFTRGKPFTFPFFRALRYKQIHIQHEYNILGWYGLPFLFLLPLLWICRRKVILTMHTVLSPGNENIGLMRTFFYLISNLIINITKYKIIVHSEVFKNILHVDYFFSEKKVFVIRHGIRKVPKLNREDIRKKICIRKNEKICLLIGTFHPDHQPHLVISQADKIKAKVFVVWNSNRGWKIVRYFNQTMKYAYMNNIKVETIDLDDEHKGMWWEFFYAADVVALPYIDGIGSGIFQDAIATRTPVVCNSTEYLREMLKDESCGELACFDHDFPRAIDNAITNVNKLKLGCDKYAKKYSVENMARKHVRVYGTN